MLTNKEKQILELRKKGLRQFEIADKLHISQPAVSYFEQNAIRKIRQARKITEFAKKIGFEDDETE